MTFYMRNYASEEKYDISKFMDYIDGTYDVVSSPFIAQLQQLPTVKYYNVNDGYKEIDLIAADVYKDVFFAYMIQYYNNDFRDTFPEGTVLKLFSASDLEQLYYTLSAQQTMNNTGT